MCQNRRKRGTERQREHARDRGRPADNKLKVSVCFNMLQMQKLEGNVVLVLRSMCVTVRSCVQPIPVDLCAIVRVYLLS